MLCVFFFFTTSILHVNQRYHTQLTKPLEETLGHVWWDEAPLQLAAVQLSHCVWGLHAWGPRGSDPTAGGNCSGSGSAPEMLT